MIDLVISWFCGAVCGSYAAVIGMALVLRSVIRRAGKGAADG